MEFIAKISHHDSKRFPVIILFGFLSQRNVSISQVIKIDLLVVAQHIILLKFIYKRSDRVPVSHTAEITEMRSEENDINQRPDGNAESCDRIKDHRPLFLFPLRIEHAQYTIEDCDNAICSVPVKSENDITLRIIEQIEYDVINDRNKRENSEYILFVPFYLQRENQENKEPARREDHDVLHRSIKHLKQSPNLADQAHVISPRSNTSLYTPDHNHRPIHTCSRPLWNQAGSSYLILMNSSCLYQHP